MARWSSGLRRKTQVLLYTVGVGSNPTLVIFFSFHKHFNNNIKKKKKTSLTGFEPVREITDDF